MVYCTQCGRPVRPGDRFCGSCGTPVSGQYSTGYSKPNFSGAVESGQRALICLREAKRELKSAQNWGIIDIIGGGMLTTIVKHNKMDQAKQSITQAEKEIRLFARALQGTNLISQIDVNTRDLLGIADWLLDNPLVDLLMQNRIQNAEMKVDAAIDRIERVLARMRGIRGF